MANAQLSELEAVNMMLRALALTPLATLEDAGDADSATAKEKLYEVSRAVQAEGWHFNSEKSVVFIPDATTGEIEVPENVLFIDASGRFKNPTLRGRKLYDLDNRTYAWTENLLTTVVYLLDWDTLPFQAQNYIAKRAARELQDARIGDPSLRESLYADEVAALGGLNALENRTADLNIFEMPALAESQRRRRNFLAY